MKNNPISSNIHFGKNFKHFDCSSSASLRDTVTLLQRHYENKGLQGFWHVWILPSRVVSWRKVSWNPFACWKVHTHLILPSASQLSFLWTFAKQLGNCCILHPKSMRQFSPECKTSAAIFPILMKLNAWKHWSLWTSSSVSRFHLKL